MTASDVISQIHEGMEVKTSDGVKLGKIKQVWYGSDSGGSMLQSDQEETLMEVRSGLLGGGSASYIPVRVAG